jgi:hypothetical protein
MYILLNLKIIILILTFNTKYETHIHIINIRYIIKKKFIV